jgi:hypothetical protein
LTALLAGTAVAQSSTAPAFAPVAPPPLIPGAAQGERQPAVSAAALAAQGAAVAAAPAASAPRLARDPAGAEPATPTSRIEPATSTSVIEDGGTRIEETKVRGAVRSIHVVPKGAAAGLAYEVLPSQGPGGPRDQAPGPSSTRGAAGQRVWSIFSF